VSARSTICRQCLTNHFGVARPVRRRTGTSAQRVAAVRQRDRRSLRKHAQNRVGERKRPGQRAARRSEAAPFWYGSIHLRFDLRRSVARLPVRHDAAACRSCVGTTTPKAAAVAKIGAALAARKRGELLRLGRPCVGRPEPWLQAGKYVSALVSDLPRRNGWTIAQRVGDRTPQRTQRLLNRACWDTFAAMGVVRRFAVAGLDEAARRCGRRKPISMTR